MDFLKHFDENGNFIEHLPPEELDTEQIELSKAEAPKVSFKYIFIE